ncbi:SANT/Myb_domain [Hexamita inflata]|uniref:SANT/Myb domain n=1 Tax=Hexamita inflata TaxID=28002 RepID=A0AA86P487_9EUKA|nr:SANT/Myb domain [Hexamita inflata]CAI9931110.1 SANT/Myb domain [Hexamita inflata]
MQSRQYGKWSEEETNKMIHLTRSYKGNVINWKAIAENINGRTHQQCKSYYNSKIRRIEVNLDALTPLDLAAMTIRDLLNNNVSKSFDTMKRMYYDQIFVEVIINSKMVMQDCLQFKFNVKMLKTIRQVYILYNQNKQVWVDQINTCGFAEFQEQSFQQYEFEHLQTLIDNDQTAKLCCKITELLQKGTL